MSNDRTVLEQALGHALSGQGAHIETQGAFAGLEWKMAGATPEGAPHSVFQLLNHMIFWQNWALKWLDGRRPAVPKHASGSWPGSVAPANSREWQQAVRRFQDGLKGLHRHGSDAGLLGGQGKKSRLEMLHGIASHNSYHVGQVVLVRQLLGAWPPPSGGVTR